MAKTKSTPRAKSLNGLKKGPDPKKVGAMTVILVAAALIFGALLVSARLASTKAPTAPESQPEAFVPCDEDGCDSGYTCDLQSHRCKKDKGGGGGGGNNGGGDVPKGYCSGTSEYPCAAGWECYANKCRKIGSAPTIPRYNDCSSYGTGLNCTSKGLSGGTRCTDGNNPSGWDCCAKGEIIQNGKCMAKGDDQTCVGATGWSEQCPNWDPVLRRGCKTKYYPCGTNGCCAIGGIGATPAPKGGGGTGTKPSCPSGYVSNGKCEAGGIVLSVANCCKLSSTPTGVPTPTPTKIVCGSWSGVWGAWGTCFGGCGGPGKGVQFRQDNCGYSEKRACDLPVCNY